MGEGARLAQLANSQPIILLGRGGSGTRLLSIMAQANGVFLGSDVNSTGDSVEWVGDLYELAIESVTAEIGAGSLRDSYWRTRLLQRAAEILDRAALSPQALWGWKLPETMLALVQVLRTFPRARIVHLIRHPVTSALRRTHMTSRLDNPVGQAVLPAAYRACGFDPENLKADPIYLHNATTWNFQVASVLEVLTDVNPDHILQLRYEDVCANPAEAQRRFGDFLGLPGASSQEPTIEWSRTGEFPAESYIVERIWSICRETASTLGYSEQVGT